MGVRAATREKGKNAKKMQRIHDAGNINFDTGKNYPSTPMKKFLFTLSTAATLAAFASTASAATNFTQTVGTGAALDIDLVGNWSNGLPTSSGNVGTININSTVEATNSAFTYTGYYLNLTGGVMGQHGVGNDPLFDGGTFSVNGGTYGTTGGRAFRNSNSNVATLTSGTINSGSNGGGTNIQSGASLIVNGGTYLQSGINRNIRVTGGSTITVNGGSLSQITAAATGTFGMNNLSTGTNFINLNGGTTSANFLAFGNNNSSSQLTLTMGGSTAGSFSAVDFLATSANELASERRIDWKSGSLMTMTITSSNPFWAKTEWDANRMFYNGQSGSTLSLTWADAINPMKGFDGVGGTYFNWNSTTQTLALGYSAVPEPTGALAGLLLGLGLLRRRRSSTFSGS